MKGELLRVKGVLLRVKARSLVKMCAEVSADDKDVVRLCCEFNFALKWSSKKEIKEAVLQKFTDNLGWYNGDDDYMYTYCYSFNYFLSYAYTFLNKYLLL